MTARPTRTLRIIRDESDPAPEPPDVLLTMTEVAGRLKVSPSTAYEMAKRGTLPGVVRFPGSTLVRCSGRALDRFLEAASAGGST